MPTTLANLIWKKSWSAWSQLTSRPAPPLNYLAFQAATAVSFLGGNPSWGGDIPHPTPRRQIMCTMSGRFRITASDGDQREFGLGQMLVLEDTTGKGHTTEILEECWSWSSPWNSGHYLHLIQLFHPAGKPLKSQHEIDLCPIPLRT